MTPSRIIKSVTGDTTDNMAGDNTLNFTDSAFDQDVINSETPVLVDFWAPWCGPCRALAPTVDAVATEFAGKVKVGKLNTDENQQTAMRYGIRSIPTLLVFKGGKVVDQRVGGLSKPDLVKMLTAMAGLRGNETRMRSVPSNCARAATDASPAGPDPMQRA